MDTIGKHIKLEKINFASTKVKFFLSIIFKALESHFHLDGGNKIFAAFMAPRMRLRTLPGSDPATLADFYIQVRPELLLVRGRMYFYLGKHGH